ncbi:uncharacterized protein TNCV_664641 [Trichonephila clavipes]|nr:uncharacterized protein TNCV_664641 [Trichonephila clavipes]
MKENIEDVSSELVNWGQRLHFLDETSRTLLRSASLMLYYSVDVSGPQTLLKVVSPVFEPNTLPTCAIQFALHMFRMDFSTFKMVIKAPNSTWESTTFEGNSAHNCQVIYSQFGLAIHQNDHQARRRFVEWAQNEIAVVPDFHKRILFSDEAHFWLNGYVNKQNCRIWSEANPQVYVETPLHPEKLTV